jgi:hypothetical protein
MITLYSPVYNEELLMQFMIDHYRERFPGCRMVFYDNISTDKTAGIARANKCEVIRYDTNNQFSDRMNMEIKNDCWKGAKTDWVLMCDLDELLDINESELKDEEKAGTTIIRSEAWDMINMEDNYDITGMKYATKSPFPGKNCLFNKKFIREINYSIGAHDCNPIGTVVYSKKFYKLYHYCEINEQRSYEKCLANGNRLSPENISNGWGTTIMVTPTQNTPELIHKEYISDRKKAVKVR